MHFNECRDAAKQRDQAQHRAWICDGQKKCLCRHNHTPKRPRKLLLKEREIAKFTGAVERKGMTLVPLSIYFNARGRAKVELALAKGKNAADKRQVTKERDWKRDQARIMRENG